MRCTDLPCKETLPCASLSTARQRPNICRAPPLCPARQRPTLCRAPPFSPHGKALARHTPRQQGAVPLSCAYARQRHHVALACAPWWRGVCLARALPCGWRSGARQRVGRCRAGQRGGALQRVGLCRAGERGGARQRSLARQIGVAHDNDALHSREVRLTAKDRPHGNGFAVQFWRGARQ